MKEFLEYAKSKGVKEIDVDTLCLLSDFFKERKNKQFVITDVVASVLCIDALTSWEITIGKKYEILNETHIQYLIKNDKGINDWIHKDWFKRL